jgi:hypothetical protein
VPVRLSQLALERAREVSLDEFFLLLCRPTDLSLPRRRGSKAAALARAALKR